MRMTSMARTRLLRLLILPALLLPASRASEVKKPPNFILISPTTWPGTNCGAFGNRAIRTPNLDAPLARGGMRSIAPT